MHRLLFITISTLSLLTAFTKVASGVPGLTAAEPVDAYLNGAFPTSSRGTGGEWTQRNYFPEVTFDEPIRIVEHPLQNKILVVGKDGLGHLITNEEGSTDKTQYFDIRPIMQGFPRTGEGGISDFAFHPEFGTGTENDTYVYLSYWYSPDFSGQFTEEGTNGYNRLSRFEIIDGSLNLATENVLISQYDRHTKHPGQDIEFGPDGFLYYTVGDESSGSINCCDLQDSTQTLTGGFWSGVLRIDVDRNQQTSHPIRRQPTHPVATPQSNGNHWSDSFSQGYYIPNDNPFLSPDGAILEEYYAYGLRNPWTMSIDDLTGEIWIADVGSRSREEINFIVKGGNYQWPYKEGDVDGPFPNHRNSMGTEHPPAVTYGRRDTSIIGQSPIGAGVYRGNLHPDLYGKFLFSDFISGGFWAVEKNGSEFAVEHLGNISGGWRDGVNSHLLDKSGRILMAKTTGPTNPGTIEIFDRIGSTANEPPTFLSETMAFKDLQSRTPANGCIPYSLNVPFWSDGAEKSRWVCVPNNGTHNSASEKIDYSEEGIWSFPVGTVFIKQFEMASDTMSPSDTFPLETRFLINGEEGYYAVTYIWNSSGTEAVLDNGNGGTLNFEQITSNGVIDRRWEYPSRTDCMVCHNREAGSVLGTNTRQLNRNQSYPTTGLVANQLETLNALGMLSPAINPSSVIPNVLTSTPTADTSASIEDRARSYLDANCAYCHIPDSVRAAFDARLTTPLSQQGIINGELLSSYDIPGEAVVVPGTPDQSILYLRTKTVGDLEMPPLSKSLIDSEGVDVLLEWIASLDGSADSDGDGLADTDDSDPFDADNDADNDGVSGHIDNCPATPNSTQDDSDFDGLGDACDNQDNNPTTVEFIAQLDNVRSEECLEVDSIDGLPSIDIGANVGSGPCIEQAAHQLLYFAPVDGTNDIYNIEFEHSGLCLSLATASSSNRTNVIQAECNGSPLQEFRLADNGGNFTLYTTYDSVLDYSLSNAGNIQQWQDKGSENQHWNFYTLEPYNTVDGESEDGASEDGASEDGASEDGASEDGASEDGASEDGASEDGASEDGASEDDDSGGDDNTGGTDNTDPGAIATSPSDGSLITPGLTLVSGTAFDADSGVASVTVRIRRASPLAFWDGTAWVSESIYIPADLDSTATSWTLPNDVDFDLVGRYRIRVRATDNAGNNATAAENAVTDFSVAFDDNVDPIAAATSPVDGRSIPPGLTPVFGTAFDANSGVDSVTVRIRRASPIAFWDGTAWVSESIYIPADLDSTATSWTLPNDVDFDLVGRYRIRVRATDNAGNNATAAENERTDFSVE